jgi:hypothetical protein
VVTAIIAHLGAVQSPGRLLASDDVLAVITLSARKILVMEGFARSFIAHSSDIDIRGVINSVGFRIFQFCASPRKAQVNLRRK